MRRVTVPIFDYDRTLCSDSHTPSPLAFKGLVKSIRQNLGIPLVILTAGSINSIDPEDRTNNVACRPKKLCQNSKLSYLLNDFNINADVCIYGQYMCAENDKDNDYELNNNDYAKTSPYSYRPIINIEDRVSYIVNPAGEKKLSVMYNILSEKGLDAEILFVDDMYHHDMSGLEGLVVDPFETVKSSYYLIDPLKTGINKRLDDMSRSLYKKTFKATLEKMSVNVWHRFLNPSRI